MIFMLIGAFSAVLYLRKRRWIDALLILMAAVALAGMTGDLRMPAKAMAQLAVSDTTSAASVRGAETLTVAGPGLRAAQWHDLPARPLRMNPPTADMLWLDFPRHLPQGRLFRLTVRRPAAAPGWRLQLLAENDQLLAEAQSSGTEASVEWLPPLAETLLLRARLLGADGKEIAQGPVPLVVTPSVPLQVRGRFGAPSFDTTALRQVLTESGAILDWEVTLGRAVTRSDDPRAALTDPNVLIIDAAWFERQNPVARAALLAQVAQGVPMIVLGAGANEPAVWSQTLDLALKPLTAERKIALAGGALALTQGTLVAPGSWSVLALDQRQQPWLWQRSWKRGRIVWLGAGEWHRYAISAPRALAQSWQEVLDYAGLRRDASGIGHFVDPLPLPQIRSRVCVQGVRPDASWLSRADHADGWCTAVWPAASGWNVIQAGDKSWPYYVYGLSDWPGWQGALGHDASRAYAARTAVPVVPLSTPYPDWPFGLSFILAMLAVWWRERRD